MNRSALFSLLCAGLLISSLFIAGCVRDRGDHGEEQTPVPTVMVTKTPGTTATPAQSPVPAVPAPSGKTCAALGGDTCTVGEDCTGSWLNAQDSFSCCSGTCSGAGAGGAVITIEPFTPPDTPAEQDAVSP